MCAALSLNLLCSVSVWQSLQDSAIAEFIAKSSRLFQIAADFPQILGLDASCDVIAMRIQSKKGCFSVQKNWINSFAFSSCPIYKSYIGQTNRKRKQIRATRLGYTRLSARTGAAGCFRSHDTVIHSAGRYSEESSRIHRGINNISVKSCEKHSNSDKATDIRTNATDVETRRNIVQ